MTTAGTARRRARRSLPAGGQDPVEQLVGQRGDPRLEAADRCRQEGRLQDRRCRAWSGLSVEPRTPASW